MICHINAQARTTLEPSFCVSLNFVRKPSAVADLCTVSQRAL